MPSSPSSTSPAQGCPAGMPSAQASSPSPTSPAQGSRASRGEGGKPQEDLVAYLKWLSKMKVLTIILGSLLSLLLVNEAIYVCLAIWGDVPTKKRKYYLWIPSTNLPPIKPLLDRTPVGTFYLLVGVPGIGKTTEVCIAAKDRGATIYLDGSAEKSFKDIQAAINRKYRSLRLNMMSWITSNLQSGLETLSSLAFWVKRFTGKHLVFIVDHVDKLAAADALQLVSWAKMQADDGLIKVILVGSEQSTNLISNNDAMTRGMLVMCYPPSANETREALSKLISTHPEEYNLNVEECLYLRGTRPTEYLPEKLSATAESLMVQFKAQHARYEAQDRVFHDVDFWFELLVAGSNGVSLEHYGAFDQDKILSEPCILEYNEKVYFMSGCSRERHAALVISAYSAEVERLSKGEDCESSQKLATAKERIVKIQECMSKKSYEDYGPL